MRRTPVIFFYMSRGPTFSPRLGPLYHLRREPFTLRITKGLVVAVENRSVVFQGAVGAFLASTAPAASTRHDDRTTNPAASSGAPLGPCASSAWGGSAPRRGCRGAPPVGNRATSA